MHALEWTDKYYEDDERLVLTQPEIHIPGIRVLGRHVQSQALPALRPHYHKDCFEFTYIAKGKISFFTGGREYLLSGGDFFVSRPNEVHSSGGNPFPSARCIGSSWTSAPRPGCCTLHRRTYKTLCRACRICGSM